MARLHLAFETSVNGRRKPRLWIELPVTAEDIRSGRVDTRKPGPHLFRGLWYGDVVDSIDSYGKVLPLECVPSMPVGRASGRASKFLKGKLD